MKNKKKSKLSIFIVVLLIGLIIIGGVYLYKILEITAAGGGSNLERTVDEHGDHI